ncbi:hypothetical protein SAMN02745903_00192 [Pseudomonas sp. URMO17WK12:I5]|nr:hypothetical protein H040_00192 [Pseudomonas sp. URMO17WK12:I7]SME90912.1 hypothetical protein SAMN02745903_00192 [Pseudomonas sp. URMO17WK12:I5]
MTQVKGPGDDTHPWPFARETDYTPWPISKALGPAVLSDLIGSKCRLVHLSDRVTEDIVPGRITILVDDKDRIIEIYKDPSLPTK